MNDTAIYILICLAVGSLSLFLSLRLRQVKASLRTHTLELAKAKLKNDTLMAQLSTAQTECQTLKTNEGALIARHQAELQALRHQQYAAQADAQKAQAETAVLQFLRQLQDKGRLLDFAMADIHRLADPQVGAAARVVQQGIRTVLNDYFELKSIRSETEGSTIAIAEDELSTPELRLLSETETGVTAKSGRLVHRGWKAQTVKLPQSLPLSASSVFVLAPAEIELG